MCPLMLRPSESSRPMVARSCRRFRPHGALVDWPGAALAGAALRSGLVAEENLAAAGAFILAIAFWSVPYLIRERAAGQTSSLASPDKALRSVAAFTFLALFSEGTMADWSGVYLRQKETEDYISGRFG